MKVLVERRCFFMDYNEYRNEYQKVILKESLRRGVSIKQRLMDTIRNSDRQDLLELFIQTNDFEGQITSDELMLADLGDDEEFKELIENDIETTKELKKTKIINKGKNKRMKMKNMMNILEKHIIVNKIVL